MASKPAIANLAAERVAARGYSASFRPNEINRCPGCGRSHWHVGRIGAECAFCSTAIPFAGAALAGRSGE